MNNLNLNPEQFCCWLYGFFEMTDKKKLNEKETKAIKEHLNNIFVKPNAKEIVNSHFIPSAAASIPLNI